MLKYTVKSLDDVQESFRQLYKPVEGSTDYVLQVEGAVAKSRVDEFRDNNIQLKNELEKYSSVDLEEYEKLKKMAIDGSNFTEEEFNEAVDVRVKSMKAQFESDVSDLTSRLEKSDNALNNLLVDQAIRVASTSEGVLNTAIDDVILRGRSIFKVVDGVAVPHDANGKVIYGKDADTPKSVTEWVGDLHSTAPHLFTNSTGAGLSSNGGNGSVDTSKMTSNQKIAAGLDNR